MRNLIITSLLLLLVSTSSFPNTHLLKTTFADEYFDTIYGEISWQEARMRLDSFSIYLKQNPEYIGYIGFETKKGTFQKAKAKINRMVKYLTQHRKIEKSRIIVIYIGVEEESITILQPVMKGKKPPFESTAREDK